MDSIQKMARMTGLLYLLLAPIGIFGLIYVPSTLIVPGDITETASNIMANETLFRLSIVSALATQIVNIFVVLFLYKMLKPVNKNYAMLMVIFLLVAVPIAFINEAFHLAVLLLLGDSLYATTFTTDQLQALASLSLDLHEGGIYIAHVFWGLWLLPMGYLVFKSGFLPRILGILLMIGCFGYLIDSLTFFVFPDFDVTISQFTFIGELLLPLWLVIKGVNVEQWKKRADEVALI